MQLISPNPLLAFIAGLASFLSPCIFPLIPSYLSYIGGISYGELGAEKSNRWGIMIKTLFFIFGFSLIFAILGAFAWGFGNILSGYTRYLQISAGIIIIILGLQYTFDFISLFNRTKKIEFSKKPAGYLGAVLVGFSFGAAWTPCTGPMLGAILAVATTTKTTGSGIILLLCYAAGIGIPFILVSLFFSSFSRQMKKITPHLKIIKIISGILLVLLGILILAGAFEELNIFFAKAAFGLEKWRQQDKNNSRLLGGIFFLIVSLPVIFFYVRKVLKNTDGKITKRMRPVRLGIILALLTLSVLCFTGVIDVALLIYNWFNFQGI